MSRARSNSLGAIPADRGTILWPSLNTQVGPILPPTEPVTQNNEAAAPTIDSPVSESWQQKNLLTFGNDTVSIVLVHDLLMICRWRRYTRVCQFAYDCRAHDIYRPRWAWSCRASSIKLCTIQKATRGQNTQHGSCGGWGVIPLWISAMPLFR